MGNPFGNISSVIPQAVQILSTLKNSTTTIRLTRLGTSVILMLRVFKALRQAGVKIAIVSNFDTRLRPLLRALNCDHWFEAVAVSAEVEAEKPNPIIFPKACEFLGVSPEDALHVGDNRRNDIWGARDVGCDAWLWGSDVHSFREVAERIGVKV